MMDFDSKEEAYLIQCYLDHPSTPDEQKRFLIAKKMNFSRLALSGQGIANQLSHDQKQKNKWETQESPKDWPFYVKRFADENTSLSAEFFWGQAKVALKKAKL